MNGVNDPAAPHAAPTAIDVGEPGIRRTRWKIYENRRAKPRSGQTTLRICSPLERALRRLNIGGQFRLGLIVCAQLPVRDFIFARFYLCAVSNPQLSAVSARDTLYIFIRGKNRNDSTHMFDILYFEIQLEFKKIRCPVSQIDI